MLTEVTILYRDDEDMWSLWSVSTKTLIYAGHDFNRLTQLLRMYVGDRKVYIPHDK